MSHVRRLYARLATCLPCSGYRPTIVISGRGYKCTTMGDHDQPIAPNLLARRFEAEGPNQRWVGDTAELRVGESGRVFLAAVVDLYSSFVVGWALSAVNDRQLVIRALEMALRRRCPEAGLLPTPIKVAPTRARTTRTSSVLTASRAV
jgi:transposase InsO family protein